MKRYLFPRYITKSFWGTTAILLSFFSDLVLAINLSPVPTCLDSVFKTGWNNTEYSQLQSVHAFIRFFIPKNIHLSKEKTWNIYFKWKTCWKNLQNVVLFVPVFVGRYLTSFFSCVEKISLNLSKRNCSFKTILLTRSSSPHLHSCKRKGWQFSESFEVKRKK